MDCLEEGRLERPQRRTKQPQLAIPCFQMYSAIPDFVYKSLPLTAAQTIQRP